MRLLFVSLLLLAASVKGQPGQRQLVQAVSFGRYQPVGVAVSSQGRLFVSFPKWTDQYQYGLVEVSSDGTQRPYPDETWNRWDTTAPQQHFVSVQALLIDAEDNLWVLDPANPNFGKSMPTGVKLLRIDLRTNKLIRVYRFEDLPLDKTSLNDVQVDLRRQLAYLSDPGRAAIVVLDLKTGKSRTLLEKHPSTVADPRFILRIDNQDVRDTKGKPFSSNVNGIALMPDGQYFYYRAITQTKLYRISTRYLADSTLTPDAVAAGVEAMGEAGVSHGMIADKQNNVYMGDSQAKTIHRFTPGGKLEVVVKDERLWWPDSFAISSDGYLYVTAAQYERLPKFNKGNDTVNYPFWLYKIKL